MENKPNTIDLDGEARPASLAWRLAIRREYRRLRRGGWGPIGARQRTVAMVDALEGRPRLEAAALADARDAARARDGIAGKSYRAGES
jgi:hypothetical protein